MITDSPSQERGCVLETLAFGLRGHVLGVLACLSLV
jgi:hypothetical protein